MQALAHAQFLPTSHIHSLVCPVPSAQMSLPKFPANMQRQLVLSTNQQNPPSPSDSSGSARSTPSNLTESTLNEEQRPRTSRKRKNVTEEAPLERKLAKEMPSQFIRDRVVSAASLTEEMLKREKLEQSLREQMGSCEDEAESSGGVQKQQARCAVCNDLAFGKHYGVNSCNGCKSYFR